MRLFLGAEVAAPWPSTFPQGRVIKESGRHLTLAFLGEVDYAKAEKLLPAFPEPPFKIGPVGKCDGVLFLPESHPRALAYHIDWFSDQITTYHKSLLLWLTDFKIRDRELLSHVTVARSPFNPEEWKRSFTEIPVMMKAIHLYESQGNLNYHPLWSYPFTLPFVEIEHTADIAFLIRGQDLSALFLHAQIALAFKFPPLLNFFFLEKPESLDQMITLLNRVISYADAEIGVPFKAVSFHGHFKNQQWEMIVDV